jgi:hypothetical protein
LDHVVGLKHGGGTVDSNLAYACFGRNRFKGSDLGSIGRDGLLVSFFNPRRQGWTDHFVLNGPVIEPMSDEA